MMTPSMKFASATTTETDIQQAALDLIDQTRQQSGDLALDLLIVFASAHHAPGIETLTQSLRDALKPTTLLGCTAEGVIGADEEIERKPAITLIAAHLPGVELVPFAFAAGPLHEMLPDGQMVPQEATQDPKLFIVLGDPFSTPVDEVLAAFNKRHPGVPVIGGLASGAIYPGQSVLLSNGTALQNGIVGVALSGDLDVDVIVSQGCRPIGSAFEVTEAEENVIQNLDGKAPLEQLQEVLEELPQKDRELLRNGVFVGRAVDAMKDPLGRGDFLVRGVVGVDQRTGAITVGDYIDKGDVVQFHLRDAATAEEDLEMMLTPHSLFGRPSGALLFSCNGRGTRLYDHENGDVSAIQRFFPDLDVCGFFCAGELGPIGGRNFLHGHTASLALIRPAARTAGAHPEVR
jgi:small ligand-binding sensory domain FIST